MKTNVSYSYTANDGALALSQCIMLETYPLCVLSKRHKSDFPPTICKIMNNYAISYRIQINYVWCSGEHDSPKSYRSRVRTRRKQKNFLK